MNERFAEVQYSKEGPITIAELIVPHGTALADALKVQDLLSRELFPKLSPRGCAPCISGLHFIIRERLQEVIRIDLDKNQFVK